MHTHLSNLLQWQGSWCPSQGRDQLRNADQETQSRGHHTEAGEHQTQRSREQVGVVTGEGDCRAFIGPWLMKVWRWENPGMMLLWVDAEFGRVIA